MKFQVIDLEVQNVNEFRRFCNPFTGNNWIVAAGWYVDGDTRNSYQYAKTKAECIDVPIPDDVDVIVGHNIKFDLLYLWKQVPFRKFLARGGRIWCTQYAEYLLRGQDGDYFMNSLNKLAVDYGGTQKIDEVKVLWGDGVLTADIDRDLLIDYLIGTEAEGRRGGDIGNTERVFRAQWDKAHRAGMDKMIHARMDGLLCTTEMEFNGLHIDLKEAAATANALETELKQVTASLQEFIADLPEGLVFNWGSNVHVSCLVFGGTIKYSKRAPVTDDQGVIQRTKAYASWPMVGGVPVPEIPPGAVQDVFVYGKRKGEPKFRKVEVPGEIKMKYQDFYHTLPGFAVPDPKEKTALTDGFGGPVYTTGADALASAAARSDAPFISLLMRRTDIVKDLGTYYIRYDESKAAYVGMLTFVDPSTKIIHHNLNHTSTVTGRLSSDKPNCQNIPRSDTSRVKAMFTSRFGDAGVMLEADYSQLEVVVQGLLSQDENLCSDLRNRIDFHCKRVSAKTGCTYEEALYRCKNDAYPDYKKWKNIRTKCKEFSFQLAYGAGAPAIALSTGMDVEEVKHMIELEGEMYPGVALFNAKVEESVNRTAKPFRITFPHGGYVTRRKGWYRSPTTTLYTFTSHEAPEWLQKRGIKESFKPTEIKNYPTQGTGGEIVQIVLGKLVRWFIGNNNYNGKALLINTVHDSYWIDCHEDIAHIVAADVKRIMEAVPEYLKELYNITANVPFPAEIEVGKSMYTKSVIH